MNRLLFALIVCTISVSVASAQSTITKETFVYSVKDTMQLQLDKYVDNNVLYKGKRPVFVYVYGGGFATGSLINALQIQYYKHFVAQDFVAIAIDYRLGLANNKQPDEATIIKAVSMACSDVIDATAFIISGANEWNIDTSNILISGRNAEAISCLTAEYDICSGGNFQESVSGEIYAGSNYIHNQFVKLNYGHSLYEEDGRDHIVALKPLQYNFGESMPLFTNS